MMLGWLKDYQDLAGGIATIVAAYVALKAIKWQVGAERRHRASERHRHLQTVMHLAAVEFDIANGHLSNGNTTWPGHELQMLDQFAVDMVEYDANMFELGKRARTLISDAVAQHKIKDAAIMALAAHEAFKQAGHERRPPTTRANHFDSTDVKRALAGKPPTTIRDLRHYFNWA
jgi:hypothetical protein